jgi:hypothetical protein
VFVSADERGIRRRGEELPERAGELLSRLAPAEVIRTDACVKKEISGEEVRQT